MVQIRRYITLFLVAAFLLSGCAYHADILKLPQEPLYNQTVMFNNVQYLPLLRFCSYYNLDWDWDLVSQKIKLEKGKDIVILRPNSRLALLNDKPIKLEHLVAYRDGAAYISAESAAFLAREVFAAEKRAVPVSKHYGIKTIVIDPGHGGKDFGAVGKYKTREKNIVLDVSKRLKKHLKRKNLNIILTREKDVFVSLKGRARLANSKGADLFISVHANASRFSRARGFEVFYLSEATDDKARAMAAAENESLKFENDEIAESEDLSTATTIWDLKLKDNRRESKGLAYYIYNITSDRMRMKKRGVKGANFAVLRGARMPAVLVELGFLTNSREASKLKKSYYREQIAEAISRSILAYKREYEKNNGFSR
ncbi:MAG: N-acetylmuramoyl-L-alanine amidase [Omnitrophica bacterium]|nr:N-acetylmuramoyl-L-alanine amidase [Candidatus Omnitrophota bacterium]